MEDLIFEVKKRTKNVAVSGIVKRFDHKVAHSKINKFNNLIKSLCQKHKLSYIDHGDVYYSMLNGPKLHLNQEGDRKLGRSFCQYPKSLQHGKPQSGANFRLRHNRSIHPMNFMNFLEQLFYKMQKT